MCPDQLSGSQSLNSENFLSDKAKAQQILCVFASILTQYDEKFAYLNHMGIDFLMPLPKLFFHCSVNLALGVALGNCVALVVVLFASAKAKQNLDI